MLVTYLRQGGASEGGCCSEGVVAQQGSRPQLPGVPAAEGDGRVLHVLQRWRGRRAGIAVVVHILVD